MRRRTFLAGVGAGLVAGTMTRPAAAQSRERPNIVFAISDDQSWLHTSAMGDPVVKTPAFDRVAREGVLFTRAFCSSPSCTPSRGAIVSGQDFWRLREGAMRQGGHTQGQRRLRGHPWRPRQWGKQSVPRHAQSWHESALAGQQEDT